MIRAPGIAHVVLPLASALALLLSAPLGCGDGGGGDTTQTTPQPLGASCRGASDCISGVCMRSEYGTPFCTRACETAWEPCPGGDDAPEGSALCVSFETLPNPDTEAFTGDLDRFCAPRCNQRRDCTDLDPAWEACDVPKYLGDELFPSLGNIRVCQSPSFQGKELVDPGLCDWEKTVDNAFASEANRCRAYCAYLDRCKELPSGADTACCEWGCYNRVVVEDRVQDAWSDAIGCYVQTHAAFPDTGPNNSCTEPPEMCGGAPTDPTPPAAQPDAP